MFRHPDPFLQLEQDGFAILPGVIDARSVAALSSLIDHLQPDGENFRQRGGVFAIRRFFEIAPQTAAFIFNQPFTAFLNRFIPRAFLVRSVFFDKPAGSNWFVPPHQDLTIQLSQRISSPDFVNWTAKAERWAAQPPVATLEGMLTFRIHLDNTDETNGALQVLPGSHRRGIIRADSFSGDDTYVTCRAKAGDVLVMRPLLVHRSLRTDAPARRRVIHLEFSSQSLPGDAEWAERQPVPIFNHEHLNQ